MGSRAMWTGNLGFGLVSIPVSLHRAIAKKRVHFQEIHDEDGGHIRHRAVCSIDGLPVSREHIVKGVELERGHLITLSAAELRALDLEATHVLEITELVNPLEIDPILYEHSYYLAPREGATRAYTILVTAMTSLRRVAIARLTLRGRLHLCVIRPTSERILLLTTLYYSEEVLSPAPFAALLDAEEPPSDRELALGAQLVETLAGRFQAQRYHDEQREQLLGFLRSRTEGAASTPPGRALPAEPVDLRAALEASLVEAERHKSAA
jgi:DNA end-binding protein Ku